MCMIKPVLRGLACVVAGLLLAAGLSAADIAQRELEPIYGFVMRADQLTLWLRSHGCTTAKDFHWLHLGQGRLLIVRDKPDYCRAAPRPVEVTVDIHSLGQQDVSLINPIQSSPLPWVLPQPGSTTVGPALN